MVDAAARQPLLGRRAGHARVARALLPPLLVACLVLGVSRDRGERARDAALGAAPPAPAPAVALKGKHSDARTPKPTPAAPAFTLAPTLSMAPTASAPTAPPTGDGHPAVIMYKRTHSSISALADAEFLRTYFGLRITYNESFAANDDAYWEGWTPGENSGQCATRVVQEVLPNFEIHFFESAVTPQGSPEGEIPMEEWVAYFERLHNGFAAHEDYDSWDAFMSNRMTFYAPDLSPFVRGLRGGGVPTFNAVYEHTLDVDGNHPKGSSGKVRVYSCSVVVPGTGQLFEVISEGLVDELKGAFDGDKIWRDWPAASCPSSNYVRQSVMELRTLWHNAGGRMKGDLGLPDLLVAKISYPGDVDTFSDYLRTHAPSLPIDRREGAASPTNCSFATSRVGGNVDLRVVANDAARSGPGRKVGDWAQYVEAVHSRWTREGEGWDRWLDNHVGFLVKGRMLDTLVPGLVDTSTPYRAEAGFMPGATTAEGSIWAGGLGGQSVEWHGEFDFSIVEEKKTWGMDYCGTPSRDGALRRRKRDHTRRDDDGSAIIDDRADGRGDGRADDDLPWGALDDAASPPETDDEQPANSGDDAAAARGRDPEDDGAGLPPAAAAS